MIITLNIFFMFFDFHFYVFYVFYYLEYIYFLSEKFSYFFQMELSTIWLEARMVPLNKRLPACSGVCFIYNALCGRGPFETTIFCSRWFAVRSTPNTHRGSKYQRRHKHSPLFPTLLILLKAILLQRRMFVPARI